MSGWGGMDELALVTEMNLGGSYEPRHELNFDAEVGGKPLESVQEKGNGA